MHMYLCESKLLRNDWVNLTETVHEHRHTHSDNLYSFVPLTKYGMKN